ncbi:DNA polymerase III subunit gamma/tau [Achromobacter spanius]|uniref:DNA polymerase III subunit gamma/tau n=1 Tax=Achromobacter spanius TaxID=217203 RepID=UPI003D160269
MPADSIVGHLQAVLGHEEVAFEVPALRLIGQAAQGSMRDALSLTDQAIAYSAGNMTEDAVRGMLGTIDQRHLVRLLDALSAGDAKSVLAVADELAIRGLSYAGALADLAVLLSRVAIEQRVKGVTAAEDPLAADIARLALSLHPDAVQLFYSVAVHSRSELTLSPDEYAGFIMACLRMLALNGDAGPQTALEAPATPARQTAEPAAASAPEAVVAAAEVAPVVATAAAAVSAPMVAPVVADVVASVAEPVVEPAAAPAASPVTTPTAAPAPAAVNEPAPQAAVASAAPVSEPVQAVSAPVAPTPQVTAQAAPQAASQAAPQPATAATAVTPAPDSVPPWEDLPAGTTSTAQAAAAPAPESMLAPTPEPTPELSPAAPAFDADAAAAVAPAAATAPAVDAAAKGVGSAALAVTPAVAAVLATAPAEADDDGPPSWVDEEIPFEAEGGFVPEGGFTSNPDDDEFETLASAPSVAPPPAARREAPAPSRKRASRARMSDMTQAGWPELAARLPVTGLAAELARQSEWAGVQGDAIVLRVAVKTLAESESRVRLQTVLCEHFGQGIRLDVQVGITGDDTAHAVAKAERAARQQAAEDAVAVDPFVQALLADFGGHVVPDSIRHVDPPAAA